MYREKGKFFEAYLHAEEVIQLVTMNATCQNLSCVERVKPDKKKHPWVWQGGDRKTLQVQWKHRPNLEF